jgi:Domain of Unknown Function (DUF928)
MSNNNYFFNLLTIGLLLVKTESTISQSSSNSQNQKPKPCKVVCLQPAHTKQPKMTWHGGVRGGSCNKNLQNDNTSQLMVLVPPEYKNENTKEEFSGLTSVERPVFWIYLPKTSAQKLALIIKEDDTIERSQTFFSIIGKTGIIGLKPSINAPSLEVGKAYTWTVVLICGKNQSPNDTWITSWVYRIAPTKQPPTNATDLELASWYNKEDIWYDALDSLAKAREMEPKRKDLIDIWTNFLNSAGLNSISTTDLQF